MALNVTTAVFGEGCNTATATPSLAQWDQGQKLKIEGVDLPSAYQVEFSTEYTRNAIPRIGNAAGVAIPNELLQRSAPITAYIVLHEGENDRETEYWITIHITPRTPPETITPDPEEQSVIDETIAALQDGVADAEAAATSAEGSASDAADHAADAEAWAVGQRAGADVPDTDPTYHNNSKYYAGRAEAAAEEAGQHEASWESWARRAETAAGNAEGSATAADQSKTAAETAAQTAARKATEAGNSADAAAGSAASARQTVDGAIGSINTAKEGALTAIGSAGTTQVNAVNQAGANQVAAVNQAGTTQVTAVEDKGAEVLDSIPQDYSELVDDVADLSRQISDETTGLDTKAPVILETASGAIASFDDGADSMPIRKIVATIEPVQSGTGDPSPDNVCPISGWTGCEIQHTGKNLIGYSAIEAGALNSVTGEKEADTSGNRVVRFIRNVGVNPNSTVTLRLTASTSAVCWPVFFWYDKNGTYVGRTNSGAFLNEYTAAVPANATNMNITIGTKHAGIYSISQFFTQYLPQLELGSTATAYEPYQGETLPITFTNPSTGDPLTIYGGTLTLNEDGSADLVSEFKAIDLGVFNWTADTASSNTHLFYVDNWDALGIVSSRYCTILKPSAELTLSQWRNVNGENKIGKGSTRLYIKPMTVSTAADAKDLMNGQYLVAKLATPITYHFSGIGQLKTSLGVNNVWCDTGDITELEYCADTKLFLTARDEEITGNIAPIENGTTASKAYAAGDYFFHDTKFCKALTAIASGATFTLGTNCQETTVAAELLAAQN